MTFRDALGLVELDVPLGWGFDPLSSANEVVAAAAVGPAR